MMDDYRKTKNHHGHDDVLHRPTGITPVPNTIPRGEEQTTADVAATSSCETTLDLATSSSASEWIIGESDCSLPPARRPPSSRPSSAHPPSTSSLVNRIRNSTRIPRPIFTVDEVVDRSRRSAMIANRRVADSSRLTLASASGRSLQRSMTSFTSGSDSSRRQTSFGECGGSRLDYDTEGDAAFKSSVVVVHASERILSPSLLGGTKPVRLITGITATCRIPCPTSDVLNVRRRATSTESSLNGVLIERRRVVQHTGTPHQLRSSSTTTHPSKDITSRQNGTSKRLADIQRVSTTISRSKRCIIPEQKRPSSRVGLSHSIGYANMTRNSDSSIDMSDFSRHRQNAVGRSVGMNSPKRFDDPINRRIRRTVEPPASRSSGLSGLLSSGQHPRILSSDRLVMTAEAVAASRALPPRNTSLPATSVMNGRPELEINGTPSNRSSQVLAANRAHRFHSRSDSSNTTFTSSSSSIMPADNNDECHDDDEPRTMASIDSGIIHQPHFRETSPEQRDYGLFQDTAQYLVAESSSTGLSTSLNSSQSSIVATLTVTSSRASFNESSQMRRRRPPTMVRIPPAVGNDDDDDEVHRVGGNVKPYVAQLMTGEEHSVVVSQFGTPVDNVDVERNQALRRRNGAVTAVDTTVGDQSSSHFKDHKLGYAATTLVTSPDIDRKWVEPDDVQPSCGSNCDVIERHKIVVNDDTMHYSSTRTDITTQHIENELAHNFSKQHSVTGSDVTMQLHGACSNDQYGVTGSYTSHDAVEYRGITNKDVDEVHSITEMGVAKIHGVSNNDVTKRHGSPVGEPLIVSGSPCTKSSETASCSVDITCLSAAEESVEGPILMNTSYELDTQLRPFVNAVRADLILTQSESTISPHLRVTVLDRVVVVEPLNFQDNISSSSFDLNSRIHGTRKVAEPRQFYGDDWTSSCCQRAIGLLVHKASNEMDCLTRGTTDPEHQHCDSRQGTSSPAKRALEVSFANNVTVKREINRSSRVTSRSNVEFCTSVNDAGPPFGPPGTQNCFSSCMTRPRRLCLRGVCRPQTSESVSHRKRINGDARSCDNRQVDVCSDLPYYTDHRDEPRTDLSNFRQDESDLQVRRLNPREYYFVTTSGRQIPIVFQFRQFNHRKCNHRVSSLTKAGLSCAQQTTKPNFVNAMRNMRRAHVGVCKYPKGTAMQVKTNDRGPPETGLVTSLTGGGSRKRLCSVRVYDIKQNVFEVSDEVSRLLDGDVDYCCRHVRPPLSSVTVVDMLYEAVVVTDHLEAANGSIDDRGIESLPTLRPSRVVAVQSVEQLHAISAPPPSSTEFHDEKMLSERTRENYQEVESSNYAFDEASFSDDLQSAMASNLERRVKKESRSFCVEFNEQTCRHGNLQFVTMSGRTKPLVFQFKPRNTTSISTQWSNVCESQKNKTRSVCSGNVTSLLVEANTDSKSGKKSRIIKRNTAKKHGRGEVKTAENVSLFRLWSRKQSLMIDEIEPVAQTIESLREQQTIRPEPLQDVRPTIVDVCVMSAAEVADLSVTDCSTSQIHYGVQDNRRLEQSGVVVLMASDRLLPEQAATTPIQTAQLVALKSVRVWKVKRLRHPSIPLMSVTVVPAHLLHAALVFGPLDKPYIEAFPPCPTKLLLRSAFAEYRYASVVDDQPRRRRRFARVETSVGCDASWLATYQTVVSSIGCLLQRRVHQIHPIRESVVIDDAPIVESEVIDTVSPVFAISTSIVTKSAALVASRKLKKMPTALLSPPLRERCQCKGGAERQLAEQLAVLPVARGTGTAMIADSSESVSGGNTTTPVIAVGRNEHLEGPQVMKMSTTHYLENETRVAATDSSSSVDPPKSSLACRSCRRSVFVQTDEKSPTSQLMGALPCVQSMEIFDAIDIDLKNFESHAELSSLDYVEAALNGPARLSKCMCSLSVPDDSKSLLQDVTELMSSESRESIHLGPMFRCPVSSGASTACPFGRPPIDVEDEQVEGDHQVSYLDSDISSPDLAKFIPIRLPVPSLMPIISHNRIDRNEWLRAQLVLDLTRDNADSTSGIHRLSHSYSDSSLYDAGSGYGNGRQPPGDVDERDGNEFQDNRDVIDWMMAVSSAEVDEVDQPATRSSEIEVAAIRQPRGQSLARATYPDVGDSRFNETTNSEFCRVNIGVASWCPTDEGLVDVPSVSEADIWAELYVELPRGRVVNVTLYHVKIELACTALRAFLDPCCQVQFSYVRSIRDKLVQLAQSDLVKPKFARFVCSDKFDCILLVSRDAGVLLRHENVGILHTLATIFELNSAERVLVMVSR